MKKQAFLVLIVFHLLIGAMLISGYTFDRESQAGQLETYLLKLQEIEKSGGWKQIKTGDTLKPGLKSDRVKQLRERLLKSGELENAGKQLTDSFDTDLENAVKKFQLQHGINPSGIADRKTVKELNVPVEKRIRQVEVNIQRWREVPEKLEELYIFVNIPSGTLELYEKHISVLNMQIIVGRFYRKTPIFNAMLNQVEFNPLWIVPPGMLKKDILPKIKTNPNFLKNNRMLVYHENQRIDPAEINWNELNVDSIPYLIVQRPGADNPMGVVKFSLPNKYFVYLHDTPAKNLFEFDARTFSSGCIRLSRAVDLAKYLLKNDLQIEAPTIDSLISSHKNSRIMLRQPVKIYICYFTAWINKDGGIQFAPDIYKRDL